MGDDAAGCRPLTAAECPPAPPPGAYADAFPAAAAGNPH
eukprot:gene21875-31291_t